VSGVYELGKVPAVVRVGDSLELEGGEGLGRAEHRRRSGDGGGRRGARRPADLVQVAADGAHVAADDVRDDVQRDVRVGAVHRLRDQLGLVEAHTGCFRRCRGVVRDCHGRVRGLLRDRRDVRRDVRECVRDAGDSGGGQVGAEERGEAVVVGGGGEPSGDLVEVVGGDRELGGDLVLALGELAAAGRGGLGDRAVQAELGVHDGQGAGLPCEDGVAGPADEAVGGRRDGEHAGVAEVVAAAGASVEQPDAVSERAHPGEEPAHEVVVVAVPVDRDGAGGDRGGQEARDDRVLGEAHPADGVLHEHDAAELERGDGGHGEEQRPAEPFAGGQGLADEGDDDDQQVEGGERAARHSRGRLHADQCRTIRTLRTVRTIGETDEVTGGAVIANVRTDRYDALQPTRAGNMVNADKEELERRLNAGEWLTPGEVAKLLGVGRTTMHDMLERGGVIRWTTKPASRHRICNPADVRRVLEN
jgi:hypothetical protein